MVVRAAELFRPLRVGEIAPPFQGRKFLPDCVLQLTGIQLREERNRGVKSPDSKFNQTRLFAALDVLVSLPWRPARTDEAPRNEAPVMHGRRGGFRDRH